MADAEACGRIIALSATPTRATLPVSVILVVLNGAKYIAASLRSITRSRCQPAEILVVDGNSSDDTRSIVAAHAGVTLIAQRSQGIANAYNEGIACAGGALIAFISHDDVWLDGKLDAQVAHLESHPQADCCVTHVEHVLERGMTPPPGFRVGLLGHAVPGMIMECLMARRDVFDRVGGFDPTFAVSEDTDWFARARDLGVQLAVLM